MLLFKRFAGIDSIEIEFNAENSQAFIDTVVRIADIFGGINLEDIPECFDIQEALSLKATSTCQFLPAF
jgi:malate dehydrogenase (oxaloacetate-decarboxylating)(NADP+)